jgi:hypothetical protein
MTNDTCSICLESLFHYAADGSMEPIGTAMCGHCFHCECFWRWEQAKTSQNWQQGRHNAPCPCPVCNNPVLEFVRLYINGDTSETARLRKEIKHVKKKLEKERLRLQQAENRLQATAVATLKTNERAVSAPRPQQGNAKPSSSLLSGCGPVDDDDMLDILNTVIQLLSSSTSPAESASRSLPITRRHRADPFRSISPSPRRPESRNETMRASTVAGRNGVQPAVPHMSSPPPAANNDRNIGRTSRRRSGGSTPTTSNVTSGVNESSPRQDAPPTGYYTRRRSNTPRLDPPSGYPSRLNTGPPTVIVDDDIPDDVSSLPSLSALLWFAEPDPPSCSAHQNRSGGQPRLIHIPNGSSS